MVSILMDCVLALVVCGMARLAYQAWVCCTCWLNALLSNMLREECMAPLSALLCSRHEVAPDNYVQHQAA